MMMMEELSSTIYAGTVDFSAHGGGGGWRDAAKIMLMKYYGRSSWSDFGTIFLPRQHSPPK